MPEHNNFYIALQRHSGRIFKILAGTFSELNEILNNAEKLARLKERKAIHTRLGDQWSIKEGSTIELFKNNLVI